MRLGDELISPFAPLPPFLVDQLSKRRVVPFVGAGLSINAGLPDWSGLLVKLSESRDIELQGTLGPRIKQAISTKQYELAADAISRALGDKLGPHIAEILNTDSVKPTVVHELLARGSWPAVITTNFDSLLPVAFRTLETLSWLDDSKMEQVLRSATPHLMFAHGTLERHDSIVLTPEQYRKCLRHPAYRTYLKVLFTHYTVLFLGFSFSDRDVNWLLEDLREEFGLSNLPHFGLIMDSPGLELRKPFLRQNFNVEVISYSRTTDSHPEVETFVRQIIDHCSVINVDGSAVKDLNAIESRKAELSRAEYLFLFAGTCEALSKSGYLRTAWVSLQSEFHRTSEDLPLQERVAVALKLVDLMIADGEFEHAHRILYSLSQQPLRTQVNRETLQKFAQVWFQVEYEAYYDTSQAVELAHEVGVSADNLAEMDAQLSLMEFLDGDEKSAHTKGGLEE